MTSAERARGAGEPAGSRDIQITFEDRDLLQDQFASLFDANDRAVAFLRQVRFPTRLIPTWTDAFQFWNTIFVELERGAMPTPFRRLLSAALRLYGSNDTLNGIARAYGIPTAGEATEPGPAPDTGQDQQPEESDDAAYHLIVRITSEAERAEVEGWLREHGMDPQPMWYTLTAVSYRLNEREISPIHTLLRTRSDLGWTLVPPGDPDHLIRRLWMHGPDGRTFRLSDIPVQSTIGSITSEVLEQYPEDTPGADRPTVTDRVGPDGQGRRMNPDNTLHQEDVGEDDHLRFAFQRTAAAVNPLDRRDALFGVRNQLQEYVDAHSDFRIWSNSSALPTEYEIEFEQLSFGPPLTPAGEPVDITTHRVLIVLGPDFPLAAPEVRWLTDIFHPNVFPTYDSEALRGNKLMRGVVCLGALGESYQPSLHFAELCATLRDIAGYRGYSIAVPRDGSIDTQTGRPVLRGDYYDRHAAMWAVSTEGQRRIITIGGDPRIPEATRKPHFGYVIEQTS